MIVTSISLFSFELSNAKLPNNFLSGVFKKEILIQNLKITIIKSNTHLLIDKIHRGEYESVLTILNNTRDRSVFFDFIDNLSSLVELFESYYQDYDLKHNELLKLKENLGLNDHLLCKLLLEIIEEE